MARSGDGTAAGPLVLTVADVLPEGAGSLDGGLVDLLVLPDVVDRAVAGDGADLLALSGASAVAGVLLNVVLDQWVGSPTVNRNEDGTRASGGGSLEVDLPVALFSIQHVIYICCESYLLVPVLQPFPTTKSPAPEN